MLDVQCSMFKNPFTGNTLIAHTKMNVSSIAKIAALALLYLIPASSIYAGPHLASGIAYAAAALKVPSVTGPEIWKAPSQPIDARVHDLVSRLSLKEKA